MLVSPTNQPLSILDFDMCFGAFVFSIENKSFSPLKRKFITNIFAGTQTVKSRPKFTLSPLPSIAIPKELLLFIASFILSFGLFSLMSKLNIRIAFPSLPKSKNVVQVSPSPLPPTPSPTPAFSREEIKIKILNGSGTRGKASIVKDVLTEKKYLEIVTGNADSFDYKTTEIQVKKDKKEAAQYVQNDLKDYVQEPKISDLDDDEAADVIIIIGQDFK